MSGLDKNLAKIGFIAVLLLVIQRMITFPISRTDIQHTYTIQVIWCICIATQ